MQEQNHIERVREFWRELKKPSTWKEPKSLIFLLIAAVLLLLWNLFEKYLEGRLEDKLKTGSIAVEYGKVETMRFGQLAEWSRRNLVAEFKLNLDDGVIERYSVVPFRIRNSSSILIDAFSFHISLGKNVRVLDAQINPRSPKNRAIKFTTGLPTRTWEWPTNTIYSVWTWDNNGIPGNWVNVYASVDRHKGYGRITPDFSEQYAVLPFAPNQKLLRWYLRLSSENSSWSEVFAEKVYPISNPALTTLNFKSSGLESNSPAILETAANFLNGETELVFESGLERNAEVMLFVLCKALDGDPISPRIRLSGARGISFEESNFPETFVVSEFSALDERLVRLMPEMVQAYAAGTNVILFWPATPEMGDSRVRVFRSKGRPLGDYSELGEMIFEGYGATNAFVLEKSVESLDSPKAPAIKGFNLHFTPPKETKTRIEIGRTGDAGKPLPPSNIRILSTDLFFDKAVHVVDAPPEKDSIFTYTIFMLDSKGNVSYPTVVNTSLNKTTENWKLKRGP